MLCRKKIFHVYYMLNDFLPSPAGVGGVKEGLPFIAKHDFSHVCKKIPQGASG